jgi:MinD-like ATPase involved in chromosome partitioning or flagellar assembly
MDTLSTPATQVVLRELSTTFNFVVVDAPHLDLASTGALLLSRTLIVVMCDDPPSVQTTGQFLTALQNLGVEAARVRVVLNHVRPANDVPVETIQKALKRPLSAEIPYDANQMTAIRRGVPLVISDSQGPFAQGIEQLARTMTT